MISLNTKTVNKHNPFVVVGITARRPMEVLHGKCMRGIIILLTTFRGSLFKRCNLSCTYVILSMHAVWYKNKTLTKISELTVMSKLTHQLE